MGHAILEPLLKRLVISSTAKSVITAGPTFLQCKKRSLYIELWKPAHRKPAATRRPVSALSPLSETQTTKRSDTDIRTMPAHLINA